ncbi:ATP12 family protein [Sphingosinicella sp. CPCC 101087]|uniref:ATP12 family chaperone protein n=1 Tax=Sphingosinicella sp. CPCC 101087 TaxID=2497754 RepID=UPI00101D0887
MRRFYKQAETERGGAVLLDGKPIRTPGRKALALPTGALAEAVAAEWNAQGEKIDPHSMPLTGLANAAIDRIALDRAAFARSLAVYGESDLLCYRAEAPPRLAERQAEQWDPILAWARRRYDADFEVATGIIHRPQPPGTLDRLAQAVQARNAFELAGLSPLVTVSGSLIVALALTEGGIDLETAWAAATLDEQWQAEQWGEDAEAAKALAARRHDFEAGFRFLCLLGRDG